MFALATAATQQTVNRAKKKDRKIYRQKNSRTEEARVKNRARAYCRKPPLHVICVRFLGYARARALHKLDKHVRQTLTQTRTRTRRHIIANSIVVKYFAKIAKFDIHQRFLFSCRCH